jgi:DnaJ-domain-containing protein 1
MDYGNEVKDETFDFDRFVEIFGDWDMGRLEDEEKFRILDVDWREDAVSENWGRYSQAYSQGDSESNGEEHPVAGNELTNAYVVLGCKPDDKWNVIQRSYRKLVKHYHPDQTDGLKNLKKFLQVQAAWEEIKRVREEK